MWETDLDAHSHVDVVEEMIGTQRKIDRWMELWQFLSKQLQEKDLLRKRLQETEQQLQMVQQECRTVAHKSLKLKNDMENQRQTLSALESTGEIQRKENDTLRHQLAAKSHVIEQLEKAGEKARRRNMMMERVRNTLLGLLAREPQSPEQIQMNALRVALLKYGNYNDLLNCRSIRKSWRDSLAPVIRKRTAQVNLDNNFVLDKFIETMRYSGTAIPTADYKLDESCLYVGNEMRLQKFLANVSPTTESLTLTCNESFVKNFRIEFSTLSPFSQLRDLFVHITNEEEAFNRIVHMDSLLKPGFLPSLVKIAPYLEKFSLIIAPAAENLKRDKYSRILQETMKALGPKCQSLELDAQIIDAHLRALKMSNLKLRHLTLVLKESVLSADGLYRFLQSQANTLESLKIIYDEPQGVMRFEFPELHNLKSLTLKGFYDKDAVEPIDYGRCFPNLRRFFVSCSNDDAGNEWNGLFSTASSPAIFVEELMLTLTRFDSVSYHRIGKLFPNVRKLRLVVAATTPEVQESLWCAMPNLEDLELHLHMGRTVCMDELFTGIPADICEQILEQRAFFDPVVDKIHKRSCLRHLKYLRKLKLYMRDHYFTDVVGYVTLVHMNELQYMEVNWDTQFDLTRECLRVLRQRFTLVSRKR